MHIQVETGHFKRVWFLAGCAVVPLSVALTIVALLSASAVLEIFDEKWYMTIADSLVLILAFPCLINGFCIGVFQKAIVKRYLRVDLGPWIAYSALGALLAGIIAYPCLDGACLPSRLNEFSLSVDAAVSIETSIVVLIYLTVFSAAQSLGLRRRVRGSWRWVAAHLAPQIVVLFALLALLAYPGLAQFNMIISLALSVLFVTVATGIVMPRLLNSNHDATELAHDEWAYQPVAIDP